jgi:hypothetical protein
MANIKEKSLLEIWSKTLQRLPKNRFNLVVSKLGLVLGLIPIFFGPLNRFSEILSSVSSELIVVYSSLLGFVIAGYTIFTTMGQPKFLVSMWKHIDSGTQLPLFKLHLLVFVKLFLALFWSLIIVICISISVKFQHILASHITLSERLNVCLQSGLLALIGWSLSAVAIHIKVLIFNLYDLTLTQVRFLEIDQENIANQDDS